VQTKSNKNEQLAKLEFYKERIQKMNSSKRNVTDESGIPAALQEFIGPKSYSNYVSFL